MWLTVPMRETISSSSEGPSRRASPKSDTLAMKPREDSELACGWAWEV